MLRIFSRKRRTYGDDRERGKLPVLHVFRYFRPDFTGEGLYFEKIARLLVDRGILNSVLVLVKSDKQEDKQPARAMPGFFVDYLNRSDDSAVGISLSLANWAIRHARGYQIAHFHSHGDRYFLGKITLRLLGCRIVQSCTLDDSPAELIASYSRPFRPIVARLLRIIDLFVVISPRLVQSALNTLPRERVRFIPQGVILPSAPKQSREEGRSKLGFAADDLLLLFVGAVAERKDTLFLVEMMPRLRRAVPHLKLVLVGPVFADEYGARITSRIAELNLADCVHLVGYIDDPGSYFRICDIFVFASRQEGFGNVIIEAMAFRLPVVSRLLPGVTDYIINQGATGFLFSEADEYCAFVERLAADIHLRQSIGEAAFARVQQNFDLAKIASEYLSTYASVANRSRNL